MSINIFVEKRYANGLVDYTDEEGNVLDKSPVAYTDEEEYYIETTPEEREQDRLAQAERDAIFYKRRAAHNKLFVVNEFAPIAPKARQPLWSANGVCYWAERELCLVAGDTGTGKTLLALQIAKELAGGRVLGDEENMGKPRHLLYIDFELDSEGFYTRFGADPDTLNNIHWAGYNSKGYMPNNVNGAAEWLLDTLDKYLVEYRVDAIIIDQPDRLHISPTQWRDLLFKLKRIMAEKALAVMLVVNTRPRNFARPMELTHIYNHKALCFAADSIVGIGASYTSPTERYMKPFKIKNRSLVIGGKLPGFGIEDCSTVQHTFYPDDECRGTQIFTGKNLCIFFTAARDEERYLMPSKSAIRDRKISSAEAMREDGFYIDEIAEELDVPERIVKRWVKGVKVKPGGVRAPLPVGPANTDDELDVYHPGLKATPPTLGGVLSAVDEFAYNPLLIEMERREMKGG